MFLQLVPEPLAPCAMGSRILQQYTFSIQSCGRHGLNFDELRVPSSNNAYQCFRKCSIDSCWKLYSAQGTMLWSSGGKIPLRGPRIMA